jgi:ArsR family transcriptional regulator
MMKITNPEVFGFHAEFCKVLANEKRLMILALLARREMNVGELVEVMQTQPANVSQHLRLLRERNIVKTRKEGQMVYYSLTDPRLMDACNLIRSILLDDLKQRGQVAHGVDVESLIEES